MSGYVVGFAFDLDERNVVLISKRRPNWQAGRLNGIGGKIEPGESPEQAMGREAMEEAGISGAAWKLFAILKTSRAWDVFYFRANVRGASTMTDEQIEWFTASRLPPAIMPNLSWLIPMARVAQQHDWPFSIKEGGAV